MALHKGARALSRSNTGAEIHDLCICIITPECIHSVAIKNRDTFTLLQHKTSVHWTVFLPPLSDRNISDTVWLILFQLT
jgi:hypothetical protein